ncbi:MAG TPA: hypothetical protein VFM98_10805 [Ramlibacter sp.]|uniref:hypothetical protein n=1 Tax=Ramlibacter sp. TaxID=1917967 RepID=UPI002D7E5B12|nr:hypothetical protein [Ramlibacter sp.]HET8746086.1 hypothetical protein [Ramlibacter sp.]
MSLVFVDVFLHSYAGHQCLRLAFVCNSGFTPAWRRSAKTRQWEFTAQQVVKGEAVYGVAEFWRDLFEEIRNMPGADEQALNPVFRLVYEKTAAAISTILTAGASTRMQTKSSAGLRKHLGS